MGEALALENAATLLYAFAILGVAVFASSGALAAGRKNLDLIGVIVIAMVTATGGGTIRDVLLDRQVFWIADPAYIAVCLIAAAATWVWVQFFEPPYRALLYADAVGLAMFAVIGAQVAEHAGTSGLIMIVMGAITGSAGGLLRDVLCAEVPLIFRKSELYVTTCIAGLTIYVGLRWFEMGAAEAGIIAAVVILALRLASIQWRITLPVMRVGNEP